MANSTAANSSACHLVHAATLTVSCQWLSIGASGIVCSATLISVQNNVICTAVPAFLFKINFECEFANILSTTVVHMFSIVL